MFYPYPNKRYSYIESVFPTIGPLYHGCSRSVCPEIPIRGQWKYPLLLMPVRCKAELSLLRSRCLRHRYTSSNGGLYKFEVHSFHPIPYPVMQESRHAGYSPIFHPGKKEFVPKYAIQANCRFPFHFYRYRRRRSSTTCLPDGKR